MNGATARSVFFGDRNLAAAVYKHGFLQESVLCIISSYQFIPNDYVSE